MKSIFEREKSKKNKHENNVVLKENKAERHYIDMCVTWPCLFILHLLTFKHHAKSLLQRTSKQRTCFYIVFKINYLLPCHCYFSYVNKNKITRSFISVSFIYSLKIQNKYNILPEIHLPSSGKSRAVCASIKPSLTNF